MLTGLLVLVGLASTSTIDCLSDTNNVKPSFSVVDAAKQPIVRVYGEEMPRRACVRLGGCEWEWEPGRGQIKAIEDLGEGVGGSKDMACEVYSMPTGVGNENKRHADCEEGAPVLRGLMFARQLMAAWNSKSCRTETPSLNDSSTDILVTAELSIEQEPFCVTTIWRPKSKMVGISISNPCSAPEVSDVPGVSLSTSDGTTRVIWRLEDHGSRWALASVDAGSSPYAQRWASAVGASVSAALRLPEKDPLGHTVVGGQELPYLLSRWSLSIAAKEGSSLDTTMREWMARMELTNPINAAATTYRRECVPSSPTLDVSCTSP